MGLFDIISNTFDTAREIVKLPVEVVKEFIPNEDNDEPGEKVLRQIRKILSEDE